MTGPDDLDALRSRWSSVTAPSQAREDVRALLARLDRAEAALLKIHGNYQPACPFCVEHRRWSDAALAPPRPSGEAHTQQIARDFLASEPQP